MIYNIIYALAGMDGRKEKLFGPHGIRGDEAFRQSVPGKNFPEIWFEIPLMGQPWFDLHVLTAVEDLDRGKPVDPEKCAGFNKAFEWFSGAENVRKLALSWDLNSGRKPAAAIQLLLGNRDDAVACDFLKAVGRESAGPSYCAFLERIPPEWFACYLGVFPSRPGHNLRVECIIDEKVQEAYAKDPAILSDHLSRVGLSCQGDLLISYCREMADSPFPLEFQFDVKEDGRADLTFGASLRFAVNEYDVDGDAGAFMKRVEDWGLSDDRWRDLSGTAFSKNIKRAGETHLMFCAPEFVKVRFRKGKPLDAKAYIISVCR